MVRRIAMGLSLARCQYNNNNCYYCYLSYVTACIECEQTHEWTLLYALATLPWSVESASLEMDILQSPYTSSSPWREQRSGRKSDPFRWDWNRMLLVRRFVQRRLKWSRISHIPFLKRTVKRRLAAVFCLSRDEGLRCSKLHRCRETSIYDVRRTAGRIWPLILRRTSRSLRLKMDFSLNLLFPEWNVSVQRITFTLYLSNYSYANGFSARGFLVETRLLN